VQQMSVVRPYSGILRTWLCGRLRMVGCGSIEATEAEMNILEMGTWSKRQIPAKVFSERLPMMI